jgi:DNA-binding transcriptional ArsR family regulator
LIRDAIQSLLRERELEDRLAGAGVRLATRPLPGASPAAVEDLRPSADYGRVMYSARDQVENAEWLDEAESIAERLDLEESARTRAVDLFLSNVPEPDRSKRAVLATSLYVAGLVEGDRSGRVTRFTARPEPLDELAAWARSTGRLWVARLAKLRHFTEPAADPTPGPAVIDPRR